MRVLGCLCLLVALFTGDVQADEEQFSPEARKRIAELQREITVLKAENKRLKVALRESDDARADKGVQPGQVQHSIVTILRDMPADLQPGKAWDKVRLPKVYKWLETELTGVPFESVMLVSKIKVGRNRNSKNPSDAWRAAIYFRPLELGYEGKLFAQYIGEKFPHPLILDGDAAFAKEMQAIPVGKKLTVTGKISQVQLMPTTFEGFWKVNILLQDYGVGF